MYNEWFLHMNKLLQNISFSFKVQMVQEKWISLSVYLFAASFLRKR